MISLDQVYLLEQKVESAVAKIQQLQAENDALRSRCNELTNALSAKSEQLNTFESDQNQIEDGIKKALDRLNSIENSVLRTAAALNNGQVSPTPQAPVAKPAVVQPVVTPVVTPQPINTQVNTAPVSNQEEIVSNEEPVAEPVIEESAPSFETMTVMEPVLPEETQIEEPQLEETQTEEPQINDIPDNVFDSTYEPEISTEDFDSSDLEVSSENTEAFEEAEDSEDTDGLGFDIF